MPGWESINNPTASCGALGERESPHKITDKAAFIPPASWRVFSGNFYKKSSSNKTYSEKLNKAYNRILKCVVEEAAQAAINADNNNALEKTFCEMTIAKGIAPQRAKLTISRDIIATAWAMWKKGEHYNPEITKQIKTDVAA